MFAALSKCVPSAACYLNPVGNVSLHVQSTLSCDGVGSGRIAEFVAYAYPSCPDTCGLPVQVRGNSGNCMSGYTAC
jgi:hypothetical protein